MSCTSRYAALPHDQLAMVVRELLLIGHLIDRSGMAWCIDAFGREEMLQIAIEEWAGASPIYTQRMQRALGYAPTEPGEGDVVTIFKGLQLDIGAPPQFMDFRFVVHDARHGEFILDHCGALMDVEPMGPDYVVGMCHDIEDPTFDATAVATNPRAQVRPIHRPPRVPADRKPHCAWTVIIDDAYPAAEPIPALAVNGGSRAATVELAPIDVSDSGLADYAGPLLSDVDFAAFSHSALARIADEVCLQMALLDNSFALALDARCTSSDELQSIRRKQFIGFAGLGAHRLVRALDLSAEPADALRLLALHPALNPAAYVDADPVTDSILIRHSPAHEDNAWISLCGPDWTEGLDAVVRALDPHFAVEIQQTDNDAWRVTVVRQAQPATEAPEVSIAKFSTGTDFAFTSRKSLPITPVSR
jgi:hypothetical protein